MDQRASTGQEGEKLANQFLRKNGYRILDERFRTQFGELDIVARKARVIAFVEVRSVSGEMGYLPEESINRRKIDRLTKCAMAWIQKKRIKNIQFRFDVITVDLTDEDEPVLNHFPAAFEAEIDF